MRYLQIYPVGRLMHDILGVFLFRVSNAHPEAHSSFRKANALAPPNGAALVEL